MVGRTLEQIGRRRSWLVSLNHNDGSPCFTVNLYSTTEVLEVMKKMCRPIEVDIVICRGFDFLHLLDGGCSSAEEQLQEAQTFIIVIKYWTSHFQCVMMIYLYSECFLIQIFCAFQ